MDRETVREQVRAVLTERLAATSTPPPVLHPNARSAPVGDPGLPPVEAPRQANLVSWRRFDDPRDRRAARARHGSRRHARSCRRESPRGAFRRYRHAARPRDRGAARRADRARRRRGRPGARPAGGAPAVARAEGCRDRRGSRRLRAEGGAEAVRRDPRLRDDRSRDEGHEPRRLPGLRAPRRRCRRSEVAPRSGS